MIVEDFGVFNIVNKNCRCGVIFCYLLKIIYCLIYNCIIVWKVLIEMFDYFIYN